MRAVFGVVSLLVVLAVVGVLVTKQLKATSRAVSSAAVQAAPGAASVAPAGTVREQSQQLQQQVTSDVAKALEQGARKDEGEK